MKTNYTKSILIALLLGVSFVSWSQIISTFAGNGNLPGGFSGDGGPATSAELNIPWGIVLGGSGNVYIADYHNERIRKVSNTGVISTFAGNGIAGYFGDGGRN